MKIRTQTSSTIQIGIWTLPILGFHWPHPLPLTPLTTPGPENIMLNVGFSFPCPKICAHNYISTDYDLFTSPGRCAVGLFLVWCCDLAHIPRHTCAKSSSGQWLSHRTAQSHVGACWMLILASYPERFRVSSSKVGLRRLHFNRHIRSPESHFNKLCSKYMPSNRWSGEYAHTQTYKISNLLYYFTFKLSVCKSSNSLYAWQTFSQSNGCKMPFHFGLNFHLLDFYIYLIIGYSSFLFCDIPFHICCPIPNSPTDM